MPGLLIVAHAPLASSLKSIAQHTFPECARELEALDVAPEMSIEEVERRARELLEVVATPDALVLTDVFGATPCNAAQRLDDGTNIRVIAGVNVPMLWRSLCYRNESLNAVVERAVAGGQSGVMPVASTKKPQNQAPPNGHDPSKHHDQ